MECVHAWMGIGKIEKENENSYLRTKMFLKNHKGESCNLSQAKSRPINFRDNSIPDSKGCKVEQQKRN